MRARAGNTSRTNGLESTAHLGNTEPAVSDWPSASWSCRAFLSFINASKSEGPSSRPYLTTWESNGRRTDGSSSHANRLHGINRWPAPVFSVSDQVWVGLRPSAVYRSSAVRRCMAFLLFICRLPQKLFFRIIQIGDRISYLFDRRASFLHRLHTLFLPPGFLSIICTSASKSSSFRSSSVRLSDEPRTASRNASTPPCRRHHGRRRRTLNEYRHSPIALPAHQLLYQIVANRSRRLRQLYRLTG